MSKLSETGNQNASKSELTEHQIWMIVIALNVATWVLIFMVDR